MIKIRLSRGGAKKNPFYRIVAIDERRKKNSASLDILGFWYPKKSSKNINQSKLNAWVTKGAKITKAVENIIK